MISFKSPGLTRVWRLIGHSFRGKAATLAFGLKGFITTSPDSGDKTFQTTGNRA